MQSPLVDMTNHDLPPDDDYGISPRGGDGSDDTDFGLNDDELSKILGEEELLDRMLAAIDPPEEEELTMDDVLTKIGGFGPFQQRLTLVLAFAFGFIPAMSAFVSIYTTPQITEVICTSPTNSSMTITTTSAEIATLCANQTWAFSNPHSITAEFGLIGDNQWMVGALNSGFFAGHALGGLIFGYISDTYGRHDIVIFTAVLTAVLNAFSICCFSYWVFFTVRVMYGMANAALMLSSWVLMFETWAPEDRDTISSLAHIPYPLGVLTITLLGFFIPHWRLLIMTESVVQIVICVWFSKVLTESPRWLMARRRITDASAVLRRIATENNNQLPRNFPQGVATNSGSESWMCGDTTACKRFVPLLLVWLVIMLASYGLNFGTETVSNNPFINISVMGLMEIPAYVFGYFVMRRGRRNTLVGFLLLSSASLFGSTMTYSHQAWRLALVCVAKFSVTGALNVAYLYTAEIFPTTGRNTGLGICSAFGRMGAALAPLFIMLAKWEKTLPLNLFGQLMLVGAFAAMTLPETAGRYLPEFVHHMRHLQARTSPDQKTSGSKPDLGSLLEFPGL